MDQPSDDLTALWRACAQGNIDTVRLFLAKGIDVNANDNKGFTALMAASYGGQFDIARLLLEKGADVNAKLNTGATALAIASFKGHSKLVQLLTLQNRDPLDDKILGVIKKIGQEVTDTNSFGGLEQAAVLVICRWDSPYGPKLPYRYQIVSTLIIPQYAGELYAEQKKNEECSEKPQVWVISSDNAYRRIR